MVITCECGALALVVTGLIGISLLVQRVAEPLFCTGTAEILFCTFLSANLGVFTFGDTLGVVGEA